MLPDAWTLAVALGLAAGFATLLSHSLRKVRSSDWVVMSGWALGGGLALGTALWSIWLLAWMRLPSSPASWFLAERLAWAWTLAAAGMTGALLLARLLARSRMAHAAVVATTVCAGALVYVVVGSALSNAPQWGALAARPALEALALAIGGLVPGLRLTNGGRMPRFERHRVQHAAGIAFLMAAALAAPTVAVLAVPMSEGAVAPASALLVAPELAAFFSLLGLATVVMGLLSAIVDSRSGYRAQALAGSLKRANRQLRELAFRDALSGLPNRLHFEERLDETLDAVGRQPSAMAVLFIDLDGFKAVNESFGHGAGDEVLREVGRRLAAVAREQDTAARIGGDEFLLLVAAPGSHEAAAAVAQHALYTLTAPYRVPGGSEVRLSCSIGIAMFPDHGPTSRLIALADAAMFAVKRTGGATYAFYEPRMELDSADQLALQTDLRRAVENGELELFYQPKVDARTRELTGVEALVRWQHPTRGAVGSTELIAVAERFGLIGQIGQWVLDAACRQMREWETSGLRIRVAVNLSAQQLRQDDLVQRIRRTLAAHRVDASLMTFEITESVAMEDTQATMRAFAQLARAGVSLAIDDFGTGHSSLAYLRSLPARQLKIDRSFVADLGISGDAMAVVDAVVRLAHALGLRVVAEGVETEVQRDILSHLDCDEFQGYLFARPMSAERLAIWASGEAGARVAAVAAPATGREPRLLQ
ncbi:MAG TPA: EAL domain-containing protein [Burkholderiaceae bacterium]|nr:EAL domain-containing protein [Burkholderiaceae bacterium]